MLLLLSKRKILELELVPRIIFFVTNSLGLVHLRIFGMKRKIIFFLLEFVREKMLKGIIFSGYNTQHIQKLLLFAGQLTNLLIQEKNCEIRDSLHCVGIQR